MPQDEFPPRGGRPQDRDLTLAPNEYAFVMDTTKGVVQTCVGPLVHTISGNDQPVRWNPGTSKFDRCAQDAAICLFVYVQEGDYVRLTNPAKSDTQFHPPVGGKQNAVDLKHGRTVNLRGPLSFALWPGQSAQVIEGHRLRSNEFLLLTVTNENEARNNWTSAVMEPQQSVGSVGSRAEGDEGETAATIEKANIVTPKSTNIDPSKLTVGQRLIICGTECSFYMPPTGIEVIPVENGRYVREAVTLERLDYCILLDENGIRRLVTGPNVVFPEPTETFITDAQGSNIFTALELNELQGVYVKVTANYTDEKGVKHRAGDELFITGAQCPVYVPREEHRIILYGDSSKVKHNSVAITAGEARYVMDRMTGDVETVKGPKMFLADPRKQLHIRRPLPERLVKLLYPRNSEAIEINEWLRKEAAKSGSGDIVLDESAQLYRASTTGDRSLSRRRAPGAGQIIAESFDRGGQYTPPRTITLETKYEGAVQFSVWPGYAVLIVDKTGKSRVVQGPSPVILDYGEVPQVFSLSTGTPKTDEKIVEDVFLKTHGNCVSDEVIVETEDLVNIRIRLSYRVNFEGDDPKKWFELDNYVQFMCKHLRSILRNAAHGYGVEAFYSDAANIVRDTVLGGTTPKKSEGEGLKAERTGRAFAENGMRVYDVEVLEVDIDDNEIANQMLAFRHSTVQGALRIRAARQKLEETRAIEDTKRESLAETMKTEAAQAEAEMQKLEAQVQIANARQVSEFGLQRERQEQELSMSGRKLQADKANQAELDVIEAAKRDRERASGELKHEMAKKAEELRLTGLNAEADALVKKTQAVSPDLIAALQGVAASGLADSMAKNFSVLAILQDKGVADVAKSVFANTPLADSINQVLRHLSTPKGGDVS